MTRGRAADRRLICLCAAFFLLAAFALPSPQAILSARAESRVAASAPCVEAAPLSLTNVTRTPDAPEGMVEGSAAIGRADPPLIPPPDAGYQTAAHQKTLLPPNVHAPPAAKTGANSEKKYEKGSET